MKKTVLAVSSLLLSISASFAQVPSNIGTDSLIGYWLFSGNANDESINQNTGTVIGSPLTFDRFQNANSAYSFDGSTNYIDFPTVFKTKAPGSFTISWWLYSLKNDFANNQLVSKNNWGGFVFHALADGSVYVGTDVTTRFTPSELPAGTISLNVWQNFVFVFNNGTGSFYKNGRLLATKTGMSNSGIWGGMTLGHPTGAYTINGYADDLAIWNKALNPNEVSAVSNPIVTSLESRAEKSSSISVYPNPTTDKLFLKSNSDYTIFNSIGTEVEKGTISGNSIDVSQLDNGVYHLQLFDNATTSRVKFIKQ